MLINILIFVSFCWWIFYYWKYEGIVLRDIIIQKLVKTIVDLIGEITMLVMQHLNHTYMQT